MRTAAGERGVSSLVFSMCVWDVGVWAGVRSLSHISGTQGQSYDTAENLHHGPAAPLLSTVTAHSTGYSLQRRVAKHGLRVLVGHGSVA